jgi:hypothetical protein
VSRPWLRSARRSWFAFASWPCPSLNWVPRASTKPPFPFAEPSGHYQRIPLTVAVGCEIFLRIQQGRKVRCAGNGRIDARCSISVRLRWKRKCARGRRCRAFTNDSTNQIR